ncbi:2,3-bisphosphoglycerate-independent phosphoglycerate mutase [Mycoplasmopsis opalescens]|uniref:2,3-bisphosphoglycerate-independent phosphoglycerate mutase n=1 Tax=Mycoplasmopsis opalescens TaxID=114886 RepID=UPI0004A769EB|nr:2,3-bisphosphoglycerate-independent phosphoglycerate mutase [Mycoplasmopsis opalescens]
MKKTILIVIDGLGLRKETKGNAFAMAKTPFFDKLFTEYPNSIIQASGEFVGLPEGQMGNSEVGHINIGAGRVVYTGLSLINQALKIGEYDRNTVFLDTFNHVKKTDRTLHLIGLLSPGGVHSLEDHLFKLLDMAHKNGLTKVMVHPIGDGRDVAPKSMLNSLLKLEQICDQYGYKIASLGGRFYGMDRDKMFDRVEKHYEAMLGKTETKFNKASDYLNNQYNQNITDEFLIPAFNDNALPVCDGDSIIFFNFRPDRARQLSHMFIGSKIYDFVPKNAVKIAKFVSMMKYEGIETNIAFEEMKVINPIGAVYEQNNIKQLRLAETQKYAHVTYFMDGGIDIVYKNSERIMVPSLKVESYATAPQMSAVEITNELIAKANDFDAVIMNYANPDMVGHTGNLESAIAAVELIDKQIQRVFEFAQNNGFTVFVTADHGNAEVMLDDQDKPATKHTSNPVMLICSDKNIKLENGKLSNIAPTILEYMGINQPKEMDQKSLISHE